MSKFSDIFNIAATIGEQFVPPKVGSILSVVNSTVQKDRNPIATMQIIAKDNDDQTAAILALNERVKRLEKLAGLI